MREDLRFSLLVTLGGLPLFAVFAMLANPHGAFGSQTLFWFGFIGIAPFIYAAEMFGPILGKAAIIPAMIAQFFWFFLWAYAGRRVYSVLRRRLHPTSS